MSDPFAVQDTLDCHGALPGLRGPLIGWLATAAVVLTTGLAAHAQQTYDRVEGVLRPTAEVSVVGGYYVYDMASEGIYKVNDVSAEAWAKHGPAVVAETRVVANRAKDEVGEISRNAGAFLDDHRDELTAKSLVFVEKSKGVGTASWLVARDYARAKGPVAKERLVLMSARGKSATKAYLDANEDNIKNAVIVVKATGKDLAGKGGAYVRDNKDDWLASASYVVETGVDGARKKVRQGVEHVRDHRQDYIDWGKERTQRGREALAKKGREVRATWDANKDDYKRKVGEAGRAVATSARSAVNKHLEMRAAGKDQRVRDRKETWDRTSREIRKKGAEYRAAGLETFRKAEAQARQKHAERREKRARGRR